MIIRSLIEICDKRYQDTLSRFSCNNCSYSDFCPHDCEKCLDYIHTPSHAPDDAPIRKYDCRRMADFYVCKYACRYTSEMIHALKRLQDLKNKQSLKVLSFGCGPCTDLLAIDCLRNRGEYSFSSLEYRGIDYDAYVWGCIHNNIKSLSQQEMTVDFFYQDACEFMSVIGDGVWIPDLVIFQYFLSDFPKHSATSSVIKFLNTFAQFANDYMPLKSYIVLNDINLGTGYGGGRDYFEVLSGLLHYHDFKRGRFCNDNSRSRFYPRGYPYGDKCDGEFPCNKNDFSSLQRMAYNPFDTCASVQMLIKKVVIA